VLSIFPARVTSNYLFNEESSRPNQAVGSTLSVNALKANNVLIGDNNQVQGKNNILIGNNGIVHRNNLWVFACKQKVGGSQLLVMEISGLILTDYSAC